MPVSPVLSPYRVPRGMYSRFSLRPYVEMMARAALANAAPSLVVPPIPPEYVSLDVSLNRSDLSPTLRQRISIVDQSDKVWPAVRKYCEPILEQLLVREAGTHRLEFLSDDLYQLILATRAQAQVHLNVDRSERLLKAVEAIIVYWRPTAPVAPPSEALARVAVLKGLFASLRPLATLPGIRIPLDNNLSITERIDELLEDAYLAEAASLRHFLSYDANKAAVARDLRLLLKTIVKKRKWARGVLGLIEHVVTLPRFGGERLLEFVEALSLEAAAGPVIISLNRDTEWCGPFRRKDGVIEWSELVRNLRADALGASAQPHLINPDGHEEPYGMER
jgi:hypothetical protein